MPNAQRLIPLAILPLAAASWWLWPEVDAIALGGMLVPAVFAFARVWMQHPRRAHLPAQSWALGTLHPLLGWAAGLLVAAAILAWSPHPDIAGPLGVVVAICVAVVAHAARLDRLLVAPALEDTEEHARATLGLALALHGHIPTTVLVLLDGSRITLVPPYAHKGTIQPAISWAEARINRRGRGRRWPPDWEQRAVAHDRDAFTSQMFHALNGRWASNKPTLVPIPPSAHALLHAKAGHA